MNGINEMRTRLLPLRDYMERSEGWGRNQGREVYQRLLNFVEDNPGTVVFRISMKGVQRMDISFASEAVVELARRFRGTKGFCLVDLTDTDLIENIDAACERKKQPMLVTGENSVVLGRNPTRGTRDAFEFVMGRWQARASEFAAEKGISIPNSSMKFKQLWEQGFLLRSERAGESGGLEYVYSRIN